MGPDPHRGTRVTVGAGAGRVRICCSQSPGKAGAGASWCSGLPESRALLARLHKTAKGLQ